jgi:hypothetical protein
MADLTRSPQQRFGRRDRTKTNSDFVTTSNHHVNKRPLDELNSSDGKSIKRRATSASIGSENYDTSVTIVQGRMINVLINGSNMSRVFCLHYDRN